MSIKDTTILEAHKKIRQDLDSGSLKLNDRLKELQNKIFKLDMKFNLDVKAWYLANNSESTDIVYCECGRKVKESELELCGFDFGIRKLDDGTISRNKDGYICPDIHCRYCMNE